MNLKKLIKKTARGFNHGISDSRIHSIYTYCINAGYEKEIFKCEESDIRDIVFSNVQNFSRINPLKSSSSTNNLCPVGGEHPQRVILSNNREVDYCSDHKLVIPLKVS